MRILQRLLKQAVDPTNGKINPNKVHEIHKQLKSIKEQKILTRQRMKMSFLQKKAEMITSRPEQEVSSRIVMKQNDRDLALFEEGDFGEFEEYMTDYGNGLAETWTEWEVEMPTFGHCFDGPTTANSEEAGTCETNMGDFECG